MFDNTDDPNPPRTVEESYAVSASASNLRVDADRRTPADMVIAAGMNPYRMGLAIERLMSEWDCSAKPDPMTPKQIEELAGKLDIEPPTLKAKVRMTPEQVAQTTETFGLDPVKLKDVIWDAVIVVPNPHAGLVRTEVDGKVAYRLPLLVAAERAQQWHSHELGLLLQRMKTLPEARRGLVWWVENQLNIRPGIHLVSAVLQWWLHKTCPVCQGAKMKIIPGTGRTSSKACLACRRQQGDKEGTGERRIPHEWRGKKLVAYINSCRGEAIKGEHGLNGKFRHRFKNEALFDRCMESLYKPWMGEEERDILRAQLRRRCGERIDHDVAMAVHEKYSPKRIEDMVRGLLQAAYDQPDPARGRLKT